MLDHDPAPFYYRGKVVMVGDAAHATGPSIGDGAAQAIEDAAVLAHVMPLLQTPEEVPIAFQAFQNVRMERSQKVVEASRQAGRIMRYEPRNIPGANFETREGIDAVEEHLAEVPALTSNKDVDEQNRDGVREFHRLRAQHLQLLN